MTEGFDGSFLERRLLIVTGKGGCGKTTIACALAVGAAERGKRVALVEMGRDEHIHKLLSPGSSQVGYEGRELLPSIWVCHIDPFKALAEYLGLQFGLRSLVEKTLRQPAFQQLLAAAPGWRELVTLGKIWYLESLREADGRPKFDLIVADAPATGHGLTFLDVPRVVQSAVQSGPLRRRAADVEALITDPKRTQLIPVCLAEELPVRETTELVSRVQNDLGVPVESVVVNGVVERPFPAELEGIGERLAKLPGESRFGELPTATELAACCNEQISRYRLNRHYLDEVARSTGLPIRPVPHLADGIRGPADLLRLGRNLFGETHEAGPARTLAIDDLDRGLSDGDLDRPLDAPLQSSPEESPEELIRDCEIVVCVGTGGVGKTTVAASLGLLAAQQGRRTLVLTIDPARRLADALGIESLDNEPRLVDLPDIEGELHAMMLDPKRTFDNLIERLAVDGAAKERILGNTIYRHASGSLAGSSEYAAMEKVLELSESERFDLIVVDTPPAQHTLDFLDAPGRLIEFFDSRLVKLLVQPALAAGRFSMRLFQRPIHAVLQMIEKLTGVGFLEDLTEFLIAIDDLADGFQDRAQRVRNALRGDHAGFVLVAGPAPESVANAQLFVGHLDRLRIRLRGVIINRTHRWEGTGAPGPGLLSDASLDQELADLAEALGDPPDLDAATAVVVAAVMKAIQVRDDRDSSGALREDADKRGCFFREVPELSEEVHDRAGLDRVAKAVVAKSSVAIP